MIEKLDELEFNNGYTTEKLNSVIQKQNECIDVLNAFTNSKEEKNERTLWVNKDCEIVKFCCERLQKDFEHKGVMQSNIEYEKVKKEVVKGWYKGKGDCPYCHAEIGMYIDCTKKEEQKEQTVNITLSERTATLLRVLIDGNTLKHALSESTRAELCEAFEEALKEE
jgi:hypothetical protein